jgi:ATP-dependent DNA helicase RecQ
MAFLRRELDDPAEARCGRCDNCTGRLWPAAVPEAMAAAAADRLLRAGTELEARKMWPTGMRELGVDVSGKIGPDLAAQSGRALGRLTDLGWGPRLRSLLATEAPDADVPGDVIAAVVKVLAAWSWDQRPASVVSLPSRTRPQLIASLASQIAEIGQLPYLGPLAYATSGPAVSPATSRQHNSAQRLHALWHAFEVPEGVRREVTRLAGPVLLVDDLVDTGWTITVAAMTLREAGAAAVLPLALAAAAN